MPSTLLFLQSLRNVDHIYVHPLPPFDIPKYRSIHWYSLTVKSFLFIVLGKPVPIVYNLSSLCSESRGRQELTCKGEHFNFNHPWVKTKVNQDISCTRGLLFYTAYGIFLQCFHYLDKQKTSLKQTRLVLYLYEPKYFPICYVLQHVAKPDL